MARLEVEPEQIARLWESELREFIEREFRKSGFNFVAAQARGGRPAALNEAMAAGGSGLPHGPAAAN